MATTCASLIIVYVLRWLLPRPPRPTMPTLTLSFAPHTRTADAAVRAPRKNLRVFGSDTATPFLADCTKSRVGRCLHTCGFIHVRREYAFRKLAGRPTGALDCRFARCVLFKPGHSELTND